MWVQCWTVQKIVVMQHLRMQTVIKPKRRRRRWGTYLYNLEEVILFSGSRCRDVFVFHIKQVCEARKELETNSSLSILQWNSSFSSRQDIGGTDWSLLLFSLQMILNISEIDTDLRILPWLAWNYSSDATQKYLKVVIKFSQLCGNGLCLSFYFSTGLHSDLNRIHHLWDELEGRLWAGAYLPPEPALISRHHCWTSLMLLWLRKRPNPCSQVQNIMVEGLNSVV